MSDIRRRNTENHEIHQHQDSVPTQKKTYILKKKETITQRGTPDTFVQQKIRQMCLKPQKRDQANESQEIRETDAKIDHSVKQASRTLKKAAQRSSRRIKEKKAETEKPEQSYSFQQSTEKEEAVVKSSMEQPIKTRENTIGIRTSTEEAKKNVVAKEYAAIRKAEKEESAAAMQAKSHAAAETAKAVTAEAKKNAVKETAQKTAKKAAASSAKETVKATASASGGGLVFIVGMILFIIFCALAVFIFVIGSSNANEEQNRQNASNGTAAVSENVLQYSDLISQYANENGIGRYVALIEAIMMQESGGVGTNVMQVNFGTVTTAEDSIRMGVGYVRTCLEMARVTDPNDMDHIKVALQGYNYGTGYISWVWNNYDGVYSEENAQEYSNIQKASLGWNIYGDPQYVPHVLRYYSVSSGDIQFITDGATFAWPVPGHTNITSTYGYRWGTLHKGIDISDGGIEGQPVVASRSGTVTRADNACPHNYPKNSSCGCGGGYGNRVEISHGDGTSTLYGHMLSITVSVGQTVNQGDIIGYVGCTGYSTGTHLHFEIKQDGVQVDPMPYL